MKQLFKQQRAEIIKELFYLAHKADYSENGVVNAIPYEVPETFLIAKQKQTLDKVVEMLNKLPQGHTPE